MRISFVRAILAAFTLAKIASAFRDLSFPSTATADSDVQLQITNDLSASSGFDHQFDSFRVYLATTPPGWGTGPACYLVNTSAINTTDLTFQIPASVGPDGDAYVVATEEFNQDGYGVGPSGYEYSDDFALTNTTGAWSEYELAGHTIGDADFVPCTAYDCARNCSQTFYPDNTNTTAGFKSTYDCIAACPGVKFPEDTLGGNSSSPTGSVTSVDTPGSVATTAPSETAMTSSTPMKTAPTSPSATPTDTSGASNQALGTTPGLAAILLGVLGVLGL